jgi:putative endonuclease
MASQRNGTIYIGAAVDLPRRVWEHRHGVVPGFTRQHGCKLLVWYEWAGDWEPARPARTADEEMEPGLEAA